MDETKFPRFFFCFVFGTTPTPNISMTLNGFAEKGLKVFALVCATCSAKVINSGCLEAEGRFVSWSLLIADVKAICKPLVAYITKLLFR